MGGYMKPKISIAIPAYIKNSQEIFYLKDLFQSIEKQTFLDYEVVISDHSKINDIASFCDSYSSKFKIKYIKNFYYRDLPHPGTENTNNAMKYCDGEYIKILHQDDFFVNDFALEKIVKCLDDSEKKWLVSGFNHTYDGKNFFWEKIPEYPDNILIGNNLIGAPTNVTIRNDSKIDFDIDPRIAMGIDVEWYHRLRMKYGMPFFINDILVTSRIRDDRISANIHREKCDIIVESDGSSWSNIQSELDYIQEKHKEFFENWEYPDEN